MTNEEIVKKIKSGNCPADELQHLYFKNLSLIKEIIKPFTTKECEEDLLQESFFGLYKAVEKYETDQNVKFMTYAKYWIRVSVIRYIENCGKLVRIPNEYSQKIAKYKKTIEKLSQKIGRCPEKKEIMDFLKIDLEELEDLEKYSQDIKSLNQTFTNENGDMCELIETLKDDFCLENHVIDNLHQSYLKDAIWGIVERNTSKREGEILQDRFVSNETFKNIAKKHNISLERVRQIENNALKKLRYKVIKSDLCDKYDFAMSGIYKTGINNFKNTWVSSTEKIAFKMLDFEKYEKKILKKFDCKSG